MTNDELARSLSDKELLKRVSFPADPPLTQLAYERELDRRTK